MADTRNDNRASLGSRFNTWWALTAFSIVVLTAIVIQTKDVSRSKSQKWAMSVPAITLSLGVLSCIAHALARERFVGKPVEGGLVTLCLIMWAAGLPTIMDPDRDIAVTAGGDVFNANIYFFSWGAFACSLILTGTFARDVMAMQSPTFSAKRNLWWTGLCATSFIVMATAVRVYKNPSLGDSFNLSCDNNSISDSDYCKRTRFGVSLGVISGVCAFFFSFFSHKCPVLLEWFFAVFLFIMWCFGVGYITFGDFGRSPATTISNFYFSTWFSFVLSLLVATDSMAETYRKFVRGEDDEGPKEPENTEPEVAVEPKV